MLKPLDRTGVWRTYSMADGLAGMRIEHIAEDSEGYLWFATMDNGVSRFDGDEFQNFTRQDGLINDRVYFILEDSQKRLWFGTLNGFAGTTEQIFTIWRTTGLQADLCSSFMKTVRGVYGVVGTGLWDITTALCSTI